MTYLLLLLMLLWLLRRLVLFLLDRRRLLLLLVIATPLSVAPLLYLDKRGATECVRSIERRQCVWCWYLKTGVA
jgi:hypothetical protein